MKRFVPILAIAASACIAFGQKPQLMYIGTLDKKLLVIDENKEDVVGEVQLGGIPRTTVLSPDRKKIHLFTTQMLLETVDLETRKVVSSFSLADPRSRPRISANSPDRLLLGGGGGNARYSGLVVDPSGRYLYTTMRVAIKDIDEYRVEAPQFVQIDLQDKKIAKSWAFPADVNQGFGFEATFKMSPDGKLLYVFQDDILIFDLSTFKQVDKIPLSLPPYPGQTPYRLAANEDGNDAPDVATSVFTSVDSVVHRGTLGLGSINLTTRKIEFTPIGPLLPMMGFQLSPDRTKGYSVMPKIGIGANRETEWWVWDIPSHSVIKKKTFEGRPTFRFSVGGDGKHLYLYGAGSSLEVWDSASLDSKKMLWLKKDTTTNLITVKN